MAASQTRHDSPYSTVVAPLDLALLADISDVVAVRAFVRSDARIVDERAANSRFFFQPGGLQFYLGNGISRFDDFFVLESLCVSVRSSYHVHVIGGWLHSPRFSADENLRKKCKKIRTAFSSLLNRFVMLPIL